MALTFEVRELVALLDEILSKKMTQELLLEVAHRLHEEKGVPLTQLRSALHSRGYSFKETCSQCDVTLTNYTPFYEKAFCVLCEQDEFLPLGVDAMPLRFREFLIRWNRAVEDGMGVPWDQKGLKKLYLRAYPIEAAAFLAEYRHFKALYKKDIEAVKRYQATAKSQS